MPCDIKQLFQESLQDHIAETFTELHKHPDVSLRVNFLLKPLFEQLLRLRMVESANTHVYQGKGVNPILKEIRQTILAIDKVLAEALKSYYDVSNLKSINAPIEDVTSKGYYEMLLSEGSTSVEERVGIT